MRRIAIDFDEDIQNLRDADNGQFVELTCIVGATILDVQRGENDQLVLSLEGVEGDDSAP